MRSGRALLQGSAKAELALPGRCLGDPDEDGICRLDHRVQRRDGDGDLSLLRWQAKGSQLGADQMFMPGHGCFDLIATAVSGRPLPTHREVIPGGTGAEQLEGGRAWP